MNVQIFLTFTIIRLLYILTHNIYYRKINLPQTIAKTSLKCCFYSDKLIELRKQAFSPLIIYNIYHKCFNYLYRLYQIYADKSTVYIFILLLNDNLQYRVYRFIIGFFCTDRGGCAVWRSCARKKICSCRRRVKLHF